jgi:ubiquinol-cytochrome c reductase cytochrome b subunit
VTLAWSVVIPLLVPLVLLGIVMLLPFVESWITGDKRAHHLLQRPRNAPTRTAFMAALVTFYGLAWVAGGNDIIAIKLHLSVNQITNALRVLLILGPVIAFLITKRWCISLQRHDQQVLLDGRETGVVLRSAGGRYRESHAPLSPADAYTLAAARRDEPIEAPEITDLDLVSRRTLLKRRLRHKLSRAMFADNLPNSRIAVPGETASPGDE